MVAPNLPEGYSIDYGDADILALFGPDGHPVAVFSADGATDEEIEKEARAHAMRALRNLDHPQRILAEALDERPPISEETRTSFRERLAAALLRELHDVVQTMTDVALGRNRRGGGE